MDRRINIQRKDSKVAVQDDNAKQSSANDDDKVRRITAAIVHQTTSYDADDEKSFISNPGSLQPCKRNAAKPKKSKDTETNLKHQTQSTNNVTEEITTANNDDK